MKKPFQFLTTFINVIRFITVFLPWGEQEGVASRSKDDLRRSSVSSAAGTGNGNRSAESAVCKIRQSLLQGGSLSQAFNKLCKKNVIRFILLC